MESAPGPSESLIRKFIIIECMHGKFLSWLFMVLTSLDYGITILTSGLDYGPDACSIICLDKYILK